MSEFKLDRFKYNWKGTWNNGVSYKRDDVVNYNGSSYVCILPHVANASFYVDLLNQDLVNQVPNPRWIKMTEGYLWVGDWEPTTYYNLGDVARVNGNVYICVVAHTSTNLFDPASENWITYLDQIRFRQNWQQNTYYFLNDIVRYGGTVYKCVEIHTSSAASIGLESDIEKWGVYYSGIEYKGNFQASVKYKLNDLVKYKASIFRCTIAHTSTDEFDESNWDIEFHGQFYLGDWDSDIFYSIGNVVKHGGYLYYSLTNNIGNLPAASVYDFVEDGSGPHWEIISKGINFVGVWNSTTNYKTGDVVRRGGNLYVALVDNEIAADGSTLDYLDESNWELVTTGVNFAGNWVVSLVTDITDPAAFTYAAGDIVKYIGNTYKALISHVPSASNSPTNEINGPVFWELVLKAGPNVALQYQGDILSFGFNPENYGDFEDLKTIPISIGDPGQVLNISVLTTPAPLPDPAPPIELELALEKFLEYKSWGANSRVKYVATDGIDDNEDPERGSSPLRPWKTIRYAALQLDDNFVGQSSIVVGVGEFQEILPIIVPKNTAVIGSELRSTVIKPSAPIAELANEPEYAIVGLLRLVEIIENLIVGNPFTKTIGNPETQILSAQKVENISFDPPQFDELNNEILQTVTSTVVGGPGSGIAVKNLIEKVVEYVIFHVNNIGSNPAVIGSNSATTDPTIINSILMLEANKHFLAEEAIAFVKLNYPQYSIDSAKFKRDFKNYVDAWKYDLEYSGTYKSLLTARYYVNEILGSVSEDMFYCRDGTGLRNATLTGLVGAITNDPVEIQETIGGSYVSLDPGWGPEHEACWIINRSPYIQNVTTFGYGVVGQKIDGALHNGGNRSMVSNDFTQVISDGIGAWVANNGRAELVSVFSYYCNVGYLATNGGIIRATNGNNSYGNYGSLARGRDTTETPITANLNNRTTQAIIENKLTFEDGSILSIDFRNAGINYSEAELSIVGSGANARAVFEDFRDDAVYSVTPLDSNAGDDSALAPTVNENIGGGGHILVQGNAQPNIIPGGDIDEITLQSNDENVEASYLGTRIIIIAGPGAGQYGYISEYNVVSKIAKVRKDSTDELGWDHLIPGTELARFTNGTTYRIEPRITFSHPGFFSEEITLPALGSLGTVIYGETSGEFINVPSQFGSLTSEDQEGLVPVVARFNVIKLGRTYEIELNNPGAGYNVGDIIYIAGELIDGVTSENNIKIIVTEVTDDSSNSIVDFYYEGIAASGAFVILPSSGNTAFYSYNGDNWTESQMPLPGAWTIAAAGNNIFVAINDSLVGTDLAAYSLDGVNWTATTMPSVTAWSAVTYGAGIFVAIAKQGNRAAYSADGISWTESTLPTAEDSTTAEWVDIAYGKEKFVAIANSENLIAYSANGETWFRDNIEVDGSSQLDWKSITYGNNKFIAIASTGEVAHCLNENVWIQYDRLLNGSAEMSWQQIKYGQGVFIAVCNTAVGGPTEFIKTSEDGINWVDREAGSSLIRNKIVLGNPDLSPDDSSLGAGTPLWISVGGNTDRINKTRLGAQAKGRAIVQGGRLRGISILDPGSGYLDAPPVTVTSPTISQAAELSVRIGDGVLAAPSWVNRGFAYINTSLIYGITGNGVADVVPVGKFISLSNLTKFPRLGSQIEFVGVNKIYTIATAIETIEADGSISGRFRITPELRVRDPLEHSQRVIVRERVSQIRLTGHDFLDIGTGNFEQTNYPDIYSTGEYTGKPENEIEYIEGGVVFYTSTDQSGNFRVGELFQVEQATGIVTLSADFFDFSGLSELRLGGIRLGGTGTIIREFSTDTLFSADSNNVVPTQRAISRYISGRLTVGGSEIATSSFIAGTVNVGPTAIRNSAGRDTVLPVLVRFDGTEAQAVGSMTAQTFFYASFREQPQL